MVSGSLALMDLVCCDWFFGSTPGTRGPVDNYEIPGAFKDII
jgi:hypothetical protein